jgi:DNA-binding MarR family transcriptional regulator
MPRQSPPPAEPPGSEESEENIDRAARAWTAIQAFVRAHNRRRELLDAFSFGRGFGRLTALLALADGPMTMGELADSQNIDPPNATVIVDKLEGLGLVRRTPHPEGNRRKLVTLTDAGVAAIARAREIQGRPPAALIDLPPEDLAALERILGGLAQAAGGESARPVLPRGL